MNNNSIDNVNSSNPKGFLMPAGGCPFGLALVVLVTSALGTSLFTHGSITSESSQRMPSKTRRMPIR